MNDTMNNDRDDSKIRKQQRNNRWPSKRSSSKLFLSSFLKNKTGPATRVVFFTTRFNAFENVGVGTRWNDEWKKKRGRKNLLKQRISSPPRIFPRARFEKRRIHSTRNRFVQTLLLHPVKSWRESCSVNERGTVLRTWGWDQPGWETSSKKNGSKGEEGVWSEERGGVKCVKLRVNRDHFGDGWTFAWIISPMMKVFAEKERRDLVFLCKRGEGEFAACNWKEKIIGSIRKMCEFGLDLKRILGDKVSSS